MKLTQNNVTELLQSGRAVKVVKEVAEDDMEIAFHENDKDISP